MTRTIYTNGVIHTLDAENPLVETVVVENGKIADLGTHDEMILQWGRAGTPVIDLQGKMASPGLIDSHLHLSGVAFHFLDLNVTGVKSKNEMLDKIKERADATPPGKWLIGMGWDENLFETGTIPTIEELDQVAPHCPVYLKRVCHHAFLVNSKALEISQYHPAIEVPTGGSVVLDPQTQKPTGLLLESASQLITRHIPEKTYEEMKFALGQAMKYSVSLGLTGAHTNDPAYLGGLDQTYRMYHELLNEGEHRLRCNLLIDYPYLKRLQEKGMYAGYGNERLQIGSIKIFADGAFGRRTALLSEAYQDAPGHFGDAMHEPETLFSMIKEAREHRMPIAVHTIGDKALADVLDILDQMPKVDYRDRLIHVSLLREDLVKRLADPSRIADIQPRFVVGDFPWVKERVGEQRGEYLYAWKTLLSAGVLCAGGSDAPVEPVDPLLGIHAALTRRAPSETHNGWYEKEKLSMYEALNVFTIGGAYATNEEHLKGTISRGKLADMTVYSKDLFSLENPDELLETKIAMTIIDGEIQNG
ncbi:putative amidohydrolase YtcJ [Brevibacillus reuszeri]|uniref:Hydrolase n=1 Tax=Brevibacillus reuszeri TaxID=54915 RepID=A0A0K9YWJ2_9BACL|nr:amidohydrolase [Brevibacillus reuszeri]KNB73094.1 hydrolase [Brevibacillus reuszeri]MED1856685.1 amidohydrolase [Brevibacillus reuszeri]GED68568.1 putative amidohydrolase YtcJ [Brevibacillus reuszeri]